MRPLTHVADGRAGSDDVLPSSEPAFPMSFCFTTEATLDSAQDNVAVEPPRFYNSLRRKRSPGAFARSPRDRQASPSPTIESLASFSSSALDLDLETVSSHTHSQHVTTDLSPPMSGMSSSPSSRRDSSTASSPRRLRRSDAPSCDSRLRAEGAPQLIMPSVVVPQRRPFSEAGKSLGKLKILIAGQQGVGKTSLVQSIAQCCQHIVHVDNAISPGPDSMNELYASTRPLPWWRTSVDSASTAGQRRYSTSEILDRNVCFVVRSGYQPHYPETSEIGYVDSQLSPLLEKPMGDTDLEYLLSSGGEGIVDIVLYMIPRTGLAPADIRSIKVLEKKTNVIPVLARCDELDAGEILRIKDHIRQDFVDNDLECFSFDPSTSGSAEASTMNVYAVSSVTRPDYDTMDASILMNSGYAQPLVPTDLEQLVERLFSTDGCAWVRHAAASKCVQWRQSQERQLYPTPDWALTIRRPMDSALSPVLTLNPFVRTQYWDRLEFTNWAQSLRRSLEAEQYLHVAAQRMSLESTLRAQQCDLVQHSSRRKSSRRRRRAKPESPLVHQDPLGLLQVASRLRRNGGFAVELLSSFGVIGCVAAWVASFEEPGRVGLPRVPMGALRLYVPL
ncbi:unnamed protein product [Clonostachys rhizophaga]|uniref:Septin-type G domain-containing protein n=1 Tax=Clonostachys rhizophaga TaxID=160324 RepID=A0A9N9VCS8_9HYPO|nr:unnamed protein product [Clonostachys rhizophaga]